MFIAKTFMASAGMLCVGVAVAAPVANQAEWDGRSATDTLVLDGFVDIIGSFESQKSMILDGSVALNLAEGTQVHLAGTLGNALWGRGGLRKQGAGALMLSNTNSYDGATFLEEGALWIAGNHALGRIGNALHAYAGTILIYSAGVVVPHNLQFQNAYAYPAQPPTGPYADDLQWRVDSGTATHNGMLIGSGTLVKQGAGLLRLNGNAFNTDMEFDVAAGGLAIDGQFSGPVRVHSGAWLQGSGEVGSAHIGQGGILASGGQAVGLRVTNDLVFDPASTFLVRVDPSGTGGPVLVQGAATLAGAVHAHTDSLSADSWQANWEHPILQADGGFGGTRFEAVQVNVPFLNAQLHYSPQQVVLQLSPNQRASTLWPFSGSWAASISSALTEDSRFVRQAALKHLNGALAGPFLWADAFHSDADRGAWAGVPGDQRRLSGVVLGMQHALGSSWRVNAFMGMQDARMNRRRGADTIAGVPFRASANAQVASTHLGVGAAWQGGSGFQLSVGAVHTWHKIREQRHVASAGLSDTPDARYAGRTLQLFGEAQTPAFVLPAARTSLTPFARVAWVETRTSSHAENGGPAALRFQSARHGVLFSTVGVKVGHTTETAMGRAKLQAVLAWRHAAGDTSPLSRQSFVRSGDTREFVSGGIPISRNVAVLQLGFTGDLGRDTTLGLGYAGQYGRGYQDHGVQLSFIKAF